MIFVGPFQLSYSILFYSILFYSILFYSILFYSILFRSVPFRSIPNQKLSGFNLLFSFSLLLIKVSLVYIFSLCMLFLFSPLT